jgi:hypothetical protein
MRHEQEARQQDCPKGIDVFERVETDPTESPSRIVAKQMRHKTVRRFVKSDGVITGTIQIVTR